MFLKPVGIHQYTIYMCISFEISNVSFFLWILVVDPVTWQPLAASEENESSTTVAGQHEGRQLPLLR